MTELPNAVYELMNVRSDLKHMRTREYVGEPLVDAEDQATKGAVTLVTKQEQCGLCWAFPTRSSWSASQGFRTAALPPELPRWTCPRGRQSRQGHQHSYPSSPTSSAGLSKGLRLPLTPRSPVDVDISSPRSLSPVSSPCAYLASVYACREGV